MMVPFVSVVVPAYNAGATIAATIEALLAQDYPSEKFEVIVVDDGSSDGTRDIASRYPVKLVSHDRNKGDSAARNTGAAVGRGDIIATTDADDVVEQGWLQHLVAPYSDQRVGAVVGSSRREFDEADWQARVMAGWYACVHGGLRVSEVYDGRGRMAQHKSVGSNQSFRRSVFREIGGFDTNLIVGMDQDILWRVEKAGYRVGFAPEAVVRVRSRPTLKAYFRQAYRYGRASADLFLKHPSRIGVRYLFNALFVPALLALLGLWLFLGVGPAGHAAWGLAVLPALFYLVKLPGARRHVAFRDMPPVLLAGYIAFLLAAIAIIVGIIRSAGRWARAGITC